MNSRELGAQKRRLSVKVEREKNSLSVLPDLAVKILDYVRDHGSVTTRNIVREYGASPNTLKATCASLVEKASWCAMVQADPFGMTCPKSRTSYD